MRIDPRVLSVQRTIAAGRTGGASSERFSLGQDAAAKTAATRSAASLASLDTILALQSEQDPAEHRRRSARRGRDVLDALDGLKAALLTGHVSGAELGRVSQGLKLLGASGDPALDRVLGEIDLRAKVELAKLGRADLA